MSTKKDNSKVEPNAEANLSESEQRARLTPGQLGMWIFISTEVMLFAAMVASYLIYRLSNLGADWPSSEVMHVSMPIGIVNTLLLVFSGVTAWASWSAAKEDRYRTARLWVLATIILGTSFLGVKSWEYYSKYKVGLMPVGTEKQLYERADYEYLSSVNNRIKSDLEELEQRKSPDSLLAEKDQERLELLYSLKANMTDVTNRNAGRNASKYSAKLIIKMMAWQIYPHPDTGRKVEDVLQPEMDRLQSGLTTHGERLHLVRRRANMVDQQIVVLDADLEPMKLIAPTGEMQQEFEQKKSWLAIKQKQSAELKVEVARLEKIIAPLRGRMDLLTSSFGAKGKVQGINEKHLLRLPVVVPNGQAWIACYILLTSIHALHLIAGLFVMVWWLFRKLDSRKAPALYVTCMYWQFVDAVWLAIFWLIYF